MRFKNFGAPWSYVHDTPKLLVMLLFTQSCRSHRNYFIICLHFFVFGTRSEDEFLSSEGYPKKPLFD
jgi:hypothetical protein